MRRWFRFGSIATAAAGLSLAACSSGDRPRQPRQPSRPPLTGQASAPSPADYVATASSIDLFEVRSSELAMSRTQNPRLREFASMMISAHKGTAAQLSFAGRRLNLLPAATLLPRHQAMLDQLTLGGDFDFHFRRQQVNVHEEALTLHSAYAARGRSPTLKPVAAMIAPIVRRHLDMLRRL